MPFPVQCRRNYPCRALRPHYSFSLHILLSSTRNCRTASRRLSNRNEDGFLIRGQVPTLKGKDLRKNSRWFKDIHLGTEAYRFRMKRKIPRERERNIFLLLTYFSRAGRPLFPGLSSSLYPGGMVALPGEERLLCRKTLQGLCDHGFRNPLNWFQWVFWHFWCQAAPINYMIYDEKNRTSLTWGGPVFYHARGSYFLFRQWKFMGNTPFPNDKLVMCLEKI